MKLQLLFTAIFLTLATLYIQQDQQFQEIDNSDLDLSDEILEQDQLDEELDQLSEVNLQLPQPIRYGIVSKRAPTKWCTRDLPAIICDKPKYLHKSQFRFYKLKNYYIIRSYEGYCQEFRGDFRCGYRYDDMMRDGNQSGQWEIEHHGDYRAIRNKVSGKYISAQYYQIPNMQVFQLRLYVNRDRAGSWEKFKLIEK